MLFEEEDQISKKQAELFSFLDSIGVSNLETFSHPPAKTVADWTPFVSNFLEIHPNMRNKCHMCKNLLIREKKSEDLFLVLANVK